LTTKFDALLIQASEHDSNRMKALRNEHSMAEFLRSRADLAEKVRGIVSDVASRGDAAVAEYTEKFDKVKLDAAEFRVSRDDLKAAHESLDETLLKSLHISPKFSSAINLCIRVFAIRRWRVWHAVSPAPALPCRVR
jgi:histidinol dehydrogenase